MPGEDFLHARLPAEHPRGRSEPIRAGGRVGGWRDGGGAGGGGARRGRLPVPNDHEPVGRLGADAVLKRLAGLWQLEELRGCLQHEPAALRRLGPVQVVQRDDAELREGEHVLRPRRACSAPARLRAGLVRGVSMAVRPDERRGGSAPRTCSGAAAPLRSAQWFVRNAGCIAHAARRRALQARSLSR
jgi:hypothetical protein